MPDDSKKNLKEKKVKNDPKEQRRHKQSRRDNPPPDKKAGETPRIPKGPDKPAVQEPGPEFYKGLKRETDEILKITEETNEKYKKKEIKSNWQKYEMPIDSYDDVEEQENIGADYEKLLQSSMSSGGHFQFKHEKSWDSVSTVTDYDQLFNIYTDDLAIAVSTIPFYERIGIDVSEFSEMDINTMDSRATKYKQKYYKDKSFTTPELDASDNIRGKLKESITSPNETINKINEIPLGGVLELDVKSISIQPLSLEAVSEVASKSSSKIKTAEDDLESILAADVRMTEDLTIEVKTDNDANKIKLAGLAAVTAPTEVKTAPTEVKTAPTEVKTAPTEVKTAPTEVTTAPTEVKTAPTEVTKPSNDTPEDLEKWLDDFLDG